MKQGQWVATGGLVCEQNLLEPKTYVINCSRFGKKWATMSKKLKFGHTSVWLCGYHGNVEKLWTQWIKKVSARDEWTAPENYRVNSFSK